MTPAGQRTVGTLADDVLHNAQISARFRPAGQYRLEKNVTAKVFLKTSAFTPSDLRLIEDQFNGFYPEWRLDLRKYAGGK